MQSDIANQIIEITHDFSRKAGSFELGTDDIFIYNPLHYAWDMHKKYLELAASHKIRVLFLGMNPGPFGMMQTGVPFGEINAVKSYLKLDGKVGKPSREHPRRPVEGLFIRRSEISGKRLWGLFAERYPDCRDFFAEHTVFNYCPLGFLTGTKSAKNLAMDLLPLSGRAILEQSCDEYLSEIVQILKPEVLIGVGKYAEKKMVSLFGKGDHQIFSIIHPSPGNPQANRDWDKKTAQKLFDFAVWR
ncbi:single-stranded DNA-binding protein [bacterium]|nr:single-stranded DNA-binding protein [bacterium]